MAIIESIFKFLLVLLMAGFAGYDIDQYIRHDGPWWMLAAGVLFTASAIGAEVDRWSM